MTELFVFLIFVMAMVVAGKRDASSSASQHSRSLLSVVDPVEPGGRDLLSVVTEDPVWQFFTLSRAQLFLGPDILANTTAVSAADCATGCLDDPSCEFFAWCPTDAGQGCGLPAPGALSTSSVSQPGACLLSFDSISNRTAFLAAAGPAVQWSSGFWCENCTEASLPAPGERAGPQPGQSPSGENSIAKRGDGLPASPNLAPAPTMSPAPNGSCVQVPNTLLYYNGSASVSDFKSFLIDTADECCLLCRNWPQCRFWSYCPATEDSSCASKLASYEIESKPGSCNLGPLKQGGKTRVAEQGTGVAWVSGSDLQKAPTPEPSAMPGAGWCTQVPNTLLTAPSSASYSSFTLDSAGGCCTLCQSVPWCSLWYYCPATESDGCFTTLASYEVKSEAGSCSLRSLEKGVKPVVDQTGATVPWVSGYVVEKPPKPSPTPMLNTSACTQVPNTLLYYDYAKYTLAVSSAEECCLRCRNSVGCELWSFCPTSQKNGCFTTRTSGLDSSPGGCSLYGPLAKGDKPLTDLTGPAVPWVSGYVVEKAPLPSPAPASPGTCSPISNTLFYVESTYSTSSYGLAAASPDECCLRCRNTVSCSYWSYCPTTEKNGCFAITNPGQSAPGSCNLKSVEKDVKVVVDQTGPETPWTSGFELEKVPAPSPVPAKAPGSCTQVPNTLLYFKGSREAFKDVKSAEECCGLCSKKLDCKIWSFCPMETGSDGCFTTQDKLYVYFAAGYCNLYSLKIGERPIVDQRGPDTAWISGYRPE